MKQLLHGLFVAAAIVCCSFQQVFAQQLPPVPVDPNVRIGKLDNGLTYYIRKNALPANRADFYIAQKVGSIQEEESQRGLAHFLEHMCFNGTTHFPGDALKQYLEHIGVKFGENLRFRQYDRKCCYQAHVPFRPRLDAGRGEGPHELFADRGGDDPRLISPVIPLKD